MEAPARKNGSSGFSSQRYSSSAFLFVAARRFPLGVLNIIDGNGKPPDAFFFRITAGRPPILRPLFAEIIFGISAAEIVNGNFFNAVFIGEIL